MTMLNNGLGLCVELCSGTKDRALWAVCERIGDDVVVEKENPAPYVVATRTDSPNCWTWGHYFENLKDAVEYLYSE